MRSIEELRETLDAHAGDVPTTRHDRAASVHQRVRVVRRRRRTVVSGAVAAALVAVAGGLTLLPGSEPDVAPTDQERRVLGMQAPATLTASGHTYRFVEAFTADSEREVSEELTASDEPRLVTWATTGTDDVRVTAANAEPGLYRSVDGDFEDWLMLAPGMEGDLAVRAREPGVAMAIYELADEAPPGVTAGGVTFRSEVPGHDLVGAGLTEPGESELQLEFTVPTGVLSLAGFCTGVPRGLRANVDVGGREGGSIDCGRDLPLDPGAGGGWLRLEGGIGVEPGARTTARVWLSDEDGTPVTDRPDVRLGLGLYEAHDEEVPVAGFQVAPTLEAYGHEWRYARHVEGPAGRPVVAQLDGDGPFVVGTAFRLEGGTEVETLVDGELVNTMGVMSGGGAAGHILVSPGSGEVEVRTAAAPGTGRVGIAIYERVS